MNELYPLRLQPILRQYLWGGRRFATILGRTLGPGDDYAESWEICDHGADQTRVLVGPLAGTTLQDLVRERGAELLGCQQGLGCFPLLLKLLDANRRLSVQVHPNDALAAQANPPDQGKTEAWVVLAAQPGATIYAGLKSGVDRAALDEAVRAGRCEECLHQFQPRVGDCVFIPAGTVHALGEGLLIYEIQQASDLTYRLFDWNRVGPDGRPRALHVAEALAATDFSCGPVAPQVPVAHSPEGHWRLVDCDKFVLDRWELRSAAQLGGGSICHLLTVVEGELRLPNDPAGPVQIGETVLVPASCGPVVVEPAPTAVVLDACVRGLGIRD